MWVTTRISIVQFMIKRMFICAALALSALCAFPEDWGGINRYAKDNEALVAKGVDPNRVVLLGNSITDSWPGLRPAFFADNDLTGRGISGHTSYQFPVRFRQDVIDLQPVAVVINAGTNDVAENQYPFRPEQTLDNIKTMVELAEAHGIRVILTSVLPAARFKWRPQISDAPERIKRLNALIEAYAREKNLPYVDYYSALVDPATGGMRAGLSPDGVHPNAEGYAIMEETLLPVITQVRGRAATQPQKPMECKQGGNCH